MRESDESGDSGTSGDDESADADVVHLSQSVLAAADAPGHRQPVGGGPNRKRATVQTHEDVLRLSQSVVAAAKPRGRKQPVLVSWSIQKGASAEKHGRKRRRKK